MPILPLRRKCRHSSNRCPYRQGRSRRQKYSRMGLCFNCKEQLKSLELSSIVETINQGAFYDCFGLTLFHIPKESKLDEIGQDAFFNCWTLSSLKFPVHCKIQRIGSGAFQKCKNLKQITNSFSAETMLLGMRVFCDCSSLKAMALSSILSQLTQLRYISLIDSSWTSPWVVLLITFRIPRLFDRRGVSWNLILAFIYILSYLSSFPSFLSLCQRFFSGHLSV